MAKIRNDLTGKTFGYLTVIKFQERIKGKGHWLCKCKCGTEAIKEGTALTCGRTMSCGCRLYESKNSTHGMSKSRVHRIWRGMLNRCTNINEPAYEDYGGRGIKVCDRWKTFENFYADMGDPPDGKTIDRTDNDGGYEPGNCRWATDLEQANNKRNVRLITKDGVSRTISEWSAELGINRTTIEGRIYSGMPESTWLQLGNMPRIKKRDELGRAIESAPQ